MHMDPYYAEYDETKYQWVKFSPDQITYENELRWLVKYHNGAEVYVWTDVYGFDVMPLGEKTGQLFVVHSRHPRAPCQSCRRTLPAHPIKAFIPAARGLPVYFCSQKCRDEFRFVDLPDAELARRFGLTTMMVRFYQVAGQAYGQGSGPNNLQSVIKSGHTPKPAIKTDYPLCDCFEQVERWREIADSQQKIIDAMSGILNQKRKCEPESPETEPYIHPYSTKKAEEFNNRIPQGSMVDVYVSRNRIARMKLEEGARSIEGPKGHWTARARVSGMQDAQRLDGWYDIDAIKEAP